MTLHNKGMSFKINNTTFSPANGFPQVEEVMDTSPPSGIDLTLSQLQSYLTELQSNSNTDFGVTGYNYGQTVLGIYQGGGVYVPTKDRIYMSPGSQAIQRVWHYIDCKTGDVVPYSHGKDSLTGTGAVVAVGGLSANYEITVNDTTGITAGNFVTIGSNDNVYIVESVTATQIRTTGFSTAGTINPNPLVINGGDANAVDGESIFLYTTEMVNGAYDGAVFCPLTNRVYLVPLSQGQASEWHYLDMNQDGDNVVVSYTNTVSADVDVPAYSGGSYDPDNNRVYFSPREQVSASSGKLHYINCATATIGEYDQPTSMIAGFSYRGMVYSPSQQRIYLIPNSAVVRSTWYYIDTAQTTPTIVEYTHGFGTSLNGYGYIGGVFSPQNNRIYFIPSEQNGSEWHYIDCSISSSDVPLVIGYSHGATIVASSEAYQGGVYNPSLNRIYFIPGIEAKETEWLYIDCTTETVVSYQHNQTIDVSFEFFSGSFLDFAAYSGGVYCPSNNTVYFCPNNLSLSYLRPTWHYLTDFNTPTSKSVASYTSFNKF